jgi:hypothetical protein
VQPSKDFARLRCCRFASLDRWRNPAQSTLSALPLFNNPAREVYCTTTWHPCAWYAAPTCIGCEFCTFLQVQRPELRQRIRHTGRHGLIAIAAHRITQAQGGEPAAAMQQCKSSMPLLKPQWRHSVPSVQQKVWQRGFLTLTSSAPERGQRRVRRPVGKCWEAQRAQRGQLPDHAQQQGPRCPGRPGQADRQPLQPRQVQQTLHSMKCCEMPSSWMSLMCHAICGPVCLVTCGCRWS